MGLKELEIKPAYDSEEDDVLTAFYIPFLSQSVSYNRLAGFFSSSALAVAAEGISAFVANGGHMKLVAGAKLTKPDIEAIQRGTENRDEVIEETMLKDLNSIEDEIIRDHVRALGWMVANKKLEIKVAIITDENENLLDEESIKQRGIFHQKVGIFVDKEGNSVSFSGSINESAGGWTQNIEEFKVFRSWMDGEKDHLRSDYHKFEKYWRGAASHLKVVDIPVAVREKLIQIAPTNFENLKLNKKERFKKEIKLRDYQNVAIDAWFKNGCHGIFQMATGSGKTVTALAAIKKLQKEKGKIAVVIACPFQHLVDQWKEVMINDFGINPIPAYGSRSSWEPKINTALQEFNLKIRDRFYTVTTYNTFCTDNFQYKLKSIKADLLFIADEAHHLGSEVASEHLPDAQFRLGLTATPDRWRDPEGTNLIKDYFGGVIYTFELKDAIEHGFLNEYLYMPVIIELNDAEISEYIEITKKIRKLWHKYNKDEEKREEVLNNLYRERAAILNTASAKIEVLERLILKEKPLSFTLIYCHDKNQLEEVANLLFDKGIMAARITFEETPEEREQVLHDFKAGRIDALVAVNCLDEGVDIPATKLAFILASSGNPRQFIQRRGRLLRVPKDQTGKAMKKEVKIYDLITSPPFEHEYEDKKNDIEQKILRRELQRFEEFCSSAKNEFQARRELRCLLDKFGIKVF